MPNQYNLLNREEEREMLPLCHDAAVLTSFHGAPWRGGSLANGTSTDRHETDEVAKSLYQPERRRHSRVCVAGRGGPWRAHGPGSSCLGCPATGYYRSDHRGKSEKHIEDAVAALQADLEPAELASTEACYSPRPAAGF